MFVLLDYFMGSGVGSFDDRGEKFAGMLESMRDTPLIAVRLDIIEKITEEIKSNQQIKNLLGEPVLEHLALVWDKTSDEIYIADANITSNTEFMELRFARLLKEIIEDHITDDKQYVDKRV